MKSWIDEGEAGNTERLPSIFLSHIFLAGGISTESEREIDLGGARAVPLDLLPPSDYIALGHLHKKQHMGKGNCYYSGSPLCYSFDEAGGEKGVKTFDLTKNGVENLRDIPLTSGRKLVRLEANSPLDAESLLDRYLNCLVELRLHLTAPLTSTESASLAAHENLVSLLAELCETETMAFESRKGFSDERLFEEFYRSQYGCEAEDELKTLFLSVMQELDK
jgi:exonuclease SbcD